MNLSSLKKTVSDDQFFNDLKILLRKCQLMSQSDKQAAIVFDIDGTLVYDGSWDKPIWSVINFCNYCKDIGIATMIVTARGGWETNIEKTKQSLRDLGLSCDSFFFRKPDDHEIAKFKTNVRRYMNQATNFNVLISIGDNPWDMGQWGGTGVLMTAHPASNIISYEINPESSYQDC
jgi:predicted secreted acid phosphatase